MRRANVRARNRRVLLAASAALLVVCVLVVGVIFSTRRQAPRVDVVSRKTAEATSDAAAADAAPRLEQAVSVPGTSSTLPVEMPDVRGKPLSVAQALLTSAGFPVLLTGGTSTHDGVEAVVIEQVPAPGAKVAAGEQVTLSSASADSPLAKHFVVVLDPGHETRADLRPEPIGPGSGRSKERVTAGSVGAATGRTECQVALELAVRVRARLEAAGIEVIMTRDRNDVLLSNAQRAELANRSRAALFLRLHADAVSDAHARGVSVLYPAGNEWVRGIADPSRRAAQTVQASMVKASGAVGRGTSPRADLAGFNYSRVPAILVEAGCLSNADEDRLLATAQYQDKLAEGIAAGVLEYLGR